MEESNDIKNVFLRPGQYWVGGASYRVRTLLGSCVSITLWHPTLRIGAMSHFLLATRGRGAVKPLDARYAEEATSLMLDELARQHVVPQECQAKLFGGGNMFPHQTRDVDLHVGQRNGETARALMRVHGIRVVSESLFGVGYRKIVFDLRTGHVWSRQVAPAEQLESGVAEGKPIR